MAPPPRRRMIVAVALAAFLAGCTTHAPPVSFEGVPAEQMGRAKSNVHVFDTAWSTVADEYYDRTFHGVDWDAAGRTYGPRAMAAADDDALYAVLNEMLGLLHDRHTRALSPEQAVDRERRATAGIGITVTRLEGRLAVTEVKSESPAEAAGVRRGWIVLAREGRPLDNPSGPPARVGQSETWDFLNASDCVIRVSIAAEVVSTRLERRVREFPSGVVLVRFGGFDSAEQRWLNEVIEAHQAAPALVLDLRGNRGGEVNVLVPIVGSFFDDSVDCGNLFSRGGRRIEKSTRPCKSAHYSGRMAVLVDGSTASASEILAAVLQERRRATIVGRKTRGAVLGSLRFPLPDDGELQISGFDYVSPAGRRIEGEGVVPDVETRVSLAALRAGADPDLEAALRVLGDTRGGR